MEDASLFCIFSLSEFNSTCSYSPFGPSHTQKTVRAVLPSCKSKWGSNNNSWYQHSSESYLLFLSTLYAHFLGVTLNFESQLSITAYSKAALFIPGWNFHEDYIWTTISHYHFKWALFSFYPLWMILKYPVIIPLANLYCFLFPFHFTPVITCFQFFL